MEDAMPEASICIFLPFLPVSTLLLPNVSGPTSEKRHSQRDCDAPLRGRNGAATGSRGGHEGRENPRGVVGGEKSALTRSPLERALRKTTILTLIRWKETDQRRCAPAFPPSRAYDTEGSRLWQMHSWRAGGERRGGRRGRDDWRDEPCSWSVHEWNEHSHMHPRTHTYVSYTRVTHARAWKRIVSYPHICIF